eukprot:5989036-Pyramimonas_sp.AAC.1
MRLLLQEAVVIHENSHRFELGVLTDMLGHIRARLACPAHAPLHDPFAQDVRYGRASLSRTPSPDAGGRG